MEEEKKEAKKQDTKPAEKVEKNVTDNKKATVAVKKEEVKKEANKKFEKATKGEAKKINNGIIIGVAIVAVILVAILVCMFLMTDSPKKSVETMLGNLKSGTYNQTTLFDLLEEENFDQETQKLLFDKLEWKILSVKEEADKATVEVEITNKDFKTIIGNYMQKVIKVAFSGQNVNEEEMTNYLMEELNNDEIQTVTSNQSIKLEKKDGKWEISEENDFMNILLPGFMEAMNAFN